MGTSGNLIMFHHQHWWHSGDGGHNFIRGDLPGTAGAFAYMRKAGSRSEPSGTCFAIMNAPPSIASQSEHLGDEPDCHSKSDSVSDAWCQQNCPENCPDELCTCDDDDDDDTVPTGKNYRPDAADGKNPDDGDHDMDPKDMNPYNPGPGYTPGIWTAPEGTVNWLMISESFGLNWTWTQLPSDFQAGWLECDPTDSTVLYGLTANCIRRSVDKGKTWTNCFKSPDLTGSFTKLLVKDSQTLFLLRSGEVPLRTSDAGASWKPPCGSSSTVQVWRDV